MISAETPAKKPKTKIKSAIEKKTKGLLAAALRQQPARKKCPKCGRARSTDSYGLRVMARDAKGVPTRIAVQSYCKTCRG